MIQKLTKEHISSVIDLHKKVLGHTLNSQIGSWFLNKLYVGITESVNNGFCYIVIQDFKVVGFVSFCLDHNSLEKQIMAQLNFTEKAYIVFFITTHPWLIASFLRQQYFGRCLKNNFSQPYVSILTLGVSPGMQGQGIGKKLIDKTKEIIRSNNVKELFVDTEEVNVRAINFYQKNDFQKVSVISGNIVLKCQL